MHIEKIHEGDEEIYLYRYSDYYKDDYLKVYKDSSIYIIDEDKLSCNLSDRKALSFLTRRPLLSLGVAKFRRGMNCEIENKHNYIGI